MRAIRVSGPNDATCQSVALRDVEAGEVLVRVRATGICGTDLEILDGSMPYYTRGLVFYPCLLYTSPSPRDQRGSRMPSSA